MGPNSGSEEQFAGMESPKINIGDEVRVMWAGLKHWRRVEALADVGVWTGSTQGGLGQTYILTRFEDVAEVNR